MRTREEVLISIFLVVSLFVFPPVPESYLVHVSGLAGLLLAVRTYQSWPDLREPGNFLGLNIGGTLFITFACGADLRHFYDFVAWASFVALLVPTRKAFRWRFCLFMYVAISLSLILVPLDWDVPFQKFPICTTYGAVFGHFACLVGMIVTGVRI